MLKNKFASASELEKQCRAFLQRGMQFQIEITSDGAERTTQILVVGKELCFTVDAIKGQFGFLNYKTCSSLICL